MNFSIRLGYHFSMIEAYIEEKEKPKILKKSENEVTPLQEDKLLFYSSFSSD